MWPAGARAASACRDVDGVAHHRIPPAVGRSDRRGEHRAPADAGLHRQRRLGLDDVPQRQQQPLLVLADHPRHAGAQPDLAAVGGDVGIEEADLVAIGRLLHEPDELIEAPRRASRRPLGRPARRARRNGRTQQQPCGARARSIPPGRCVRTAAGRNAAITSSVGVGSPGGDTQSRSGGDRASRNPGPTLRADTAARQSPRGSWADHDLARRRGALHRHDGRRRRHRRSAARDASRRRRTSGSSRGAPRPTSAARRCVGPARMWPTSRSVRRIAAAALHARSVCSSS